MKNKLKILNFLIFRVNFFCKGFFYGIYKLKNRVFLIHQLHFPEPSVIIKIFTNFSMCKLCMDVGAND